MRRRYVTDIFATLRKYEYNADLMRLAVRGRWWQMSDP